MSLSSTRLRFCQASAYRCHSDAGTALGKEAGVWLRLGICLVAVSGSTALAVDQSPNFEEAGRPPNLSTAAVFEPYLDRMLLTSPTFRSQCRRLGAAPVRVHLWLEDPQRRPSFSARTVFERHKGVVVAANVFLLPSLNAVELIAHEIEHVLEQLDGVDLETQVGSGNVWKREDGAFETRRAMEAGLRVAREAKERSKEPQRSR